MWATGFLLQISKYRNASHHTATLFLCPKRHQSHCYGFYFESLLKFALVTSAGYKKASP